MRQWTTGNVHGHEVEHAEGRAAEGAASAALDGAGTSAILAGLVCELPWTPDAVDILGEYPVERRQQVVRDIEAQANSMRLWVVTASVVRATGPWFGED
jgi:hypothetical protein